MKGLSSLERSVVECIGKSKLSYDEVKKETGLHENVCFNIIQALLIRGILRSQEGKYCVSDSLSPLVLEEINGAEAKYAESLEMIEAVVEQKQDKVFRFQKVAMDERDEKIFLAMLSNLESFLADAHKKAQKHTPFKERKVVFWGVGEVQKLMSQIMMGK